MNQIGYFGKTPHRGDFVRFNLPGTFTTVWDDWLQQLMIAAEKKYENKWPAIYTTAPSYRFALSKGTVGDAAWAGILIPSVDKVGRRFPFCLAASLQPSEFPANLLANPPTWFTTLLSLADAVNDPDYDFNALQTELAELANTIEPAANQSIETVHGEYASDFIKIVTDSSTTLNRRASSSLLLDSVLGQTAFQYSLWITHTRTNEGFTYLTNGLPALTDSLSLFDQRWKHSSGVFISDDNTDVHTEQSTVPEANDELSSISQFSTQQMPSTLARTDSASIASKEDHRPPDQAIVEKNRDSEALEQRAGSETADGSEITERAIQPVEENGEAPSSQPDKHTGEGASPGTASNTETGSEDRSDEEQVFTTGDWSDFAQPEAIKPTVSSNPSVEKLEIEDDSETDEPWER